MANQQAWNDRERFIALYSSLQQSIDNFIARFTEIMEFKSEVLDNPDRKIEMKKLIDEDPDWTLIKIQNKYNEFKVIYDYLTQ